MLAAAAAALDPSFNGSGWASTEANIPNTSVPVATLKQADGKFIVSVSSADQGLVRFNANGTIDQTFGRQGRVSNRPLLPVSRLAAQSDGKIITGGSVSDLTYLRISRLNVDGSIDTTYGNGGAADIASPDFRANYLSLGGVVVDAANRTWVFGCNSYPTRKMFVTRLTPEGAPDPSFADGGVLYLPYAFGVYPFAQADGKVVILVALTGSTNVNRMIRLNPDGTQDATFGAAGGGGVTTIPSNSQQSVFGAVRDPSGNFLVGVSSYGSTPSVARFTAAGILDRTYGNTSGVSSAPMYSSGFANYASGLGVDSLGRALVGGTIGNTTQRFTVCRVTANGLGLDTTFDGDGRANILIGDKTGRCTYFATDAQNNVMAIGVDDANYDGNLTIAKFLGSNGALDNGFDGDGIYTYAGYRHGDDAPVGIARQSDGKLLLLANGGSNAFGTYFSGLTRFNTDGTIDATFGTDGTVNITGYCSGLAIWNDRAVVLGANTVYRFTSAGTPDNTFSGDGKAPTSTTTTSDAFVAVDPVTGAIFYTHSSSQIVKLTAAGSPDTSFDGDGTFQGISSIVALQPGGGGSLVGLSGNMLQRILPNGTFDPAFGTAAGGGTALDATEQYTAIAVNPADGSIYVASTDGTGQTYQWETHLRHFSASGVPDAAFGTNGVGTADVLTSDFPQNYVEAVNGLALYADGTAVAQVSLSPYGGGIPYPGTALVQFTPAGRLDSNFDADGIRFIPATTANGLPFLTGDVMIDPQGRVLAAGYRYAAANTSYLNKDAVIARFTTGPENEPHVTSVDVPASATQLVVRYSFDQNLGASLNPQDLKLRSFDGIVVAGASTASFDAATNIATFTVSESLPAGLYRVSLLSAGVANPAGSPLDATNQMDVAYVPAGSTLALPAGVTRVNAVSAAGRLDVGSGALVIDYTGVSPLGSAASSNRSGIAGMLASGFNAGAWNGSGIMTSSPTSATGLTTLGYAEAKGILGLSGAQTATWNGISVDATAVLIKHTYGGDANLDGQVDIGDLGLLAGAWQQSSGKVWFDGDFTYDGAVDIGDLGLLSGNWQKAVDSGQVLMSFDAAMAQTVFGLAPTPMSPVFSIDDVLISEGNSGTRVARFTITRTGDLSAVTSVAYATADGTAMANVRGRGDYRVTSGTLTFAPGQTTATVDVPVLGDRRVEPHESFTLVLSAPVGSALGKAVGVATVTDDDGPRLVVSGRALKADSQRTFSGVMASFTDVDFPDSVVGDRFGVTVLWGDGQSAAGTASYNTATRRWELSAAHRYARKGKFNVSVRVADANGATGSAICAMTALT